MVEGEKMLCDFCGLELGGGRRGGSAALMAASSLSYYWRLSKIRHLYEDIQQRGVMLADGTVNPAIEAHRKMLMISCASHQPPLWL
jgi:hypothetical protein